MTLVPKFPTINTKRLSTSAVMNLNQLPWLNPVSLARANLIHPTLSGESIIECMNQKGEKIISFSLKLKFEKNKLADNHKLNIKIIK